MSGDDIFMIWTGNEDELREFIECLSNLHPTIKFTSEQSSSSVAFLDTTSKTVKFQQISMLSQLTPTNTSSAHLLPPISYKKIHPLQSWITPPPHLFR